MRRRTTSHPVLAPLLFVAHAAKRVPRRWWLLFAIVAVTAVCFTDSATTHNTIRVRRKPAIQMAGYNAPMNDQTSRNLIENTVEALMNHSTVKVRAPGSLSGPLCVFVPTNLDDKEHELEMNAFLNTWADGSVTLFTESLTIGSMRKPNSHGTFVSLASQSRWNMAQARRILTQKKLRWRGATEDSIRGRGQLSIPLFRWMAELVQTDDPFVKNCKWFMKCDSDTYLRRGLLETALLNHLNHSKPYHVGVPLHFDTFPFNLTARLQFEYNIGGPGYTFSRGLLQSLDMLGCAQAMAEDPILLVHDDVATGYCATYHTREPSERIDVQNAISTSSFKLVDLIIDRAWASIRDPAQNTSTCSCLDAVVAMHPARPKYMYSLFSRHIGPKRINSTACMQSSLGDVANHHCHATLMYGNPPVVGDGFDIHPALEAMMKNWSNAAKLVSRVTSDLSAKAFRV